MSGRSSPEQDDFSTAQDLSGQLSDLQSNGFIPELQVIAEENSSIFDDFDPRLNLDGDNGFSPTSSPAMPTTRSGAGSTTGSLIMTGGAFNYGSIPWYSGHPEGTKYGEKNQQTESFSVTNWCAMFDKESDGRLTHTFRSTGDDRGFTLQSVHEAAHRVAALPGSLSSQRFS